MTRSAVVEVPPGSGIHGRPILEDDPFTRHLAYHAPLGDRWGLTWCRKPVMWDHECPVGHDKLEAARKRPIGNCEPCQIAYEREQAQKQLAKIAKKIPVVRRR